MSLQKTPKVSSKLKPLLHREVNKHTERDKEVARNVLTSLLAKTREVSSHRVVTSINYEI